MTLTSRESAFLRVAYSKKESLNLIVDMLLFILSTITVLNLIYISWILFELDSICNLEIHMVSSTIFY